MYSKPLALARVLVVTCGLFLTVLPQSFSAPKGKLRIAVMEFSTASASKDDAALGKGMQSMMTTDLSVIPRFVLVERARLNDIKAELKLSSGKLVNKRTAVKVGKLVGATHMVTGSVTVRGEKMRMDCRLFAVKTGKVLLGTAVSGEKDAFFELEKALVNKLVSAIGYKMAPRERARIGRVHTADLKAFRKYSQGIAAFDAKRYSAAVKALRAAHRQDSDFKLAVVTLQRYEELIRKVKARTQTVRVYENEKARFNRSKVAQVDVQNAKQLYAVAEGRTKLPMKDGKTRKAVRLIALDVLVAGYQGSFARLYKLEDHFAFRRTSEVLAKAYFLGSREVFPLVKLFAGNEGAPVFAGRSSFNSRFRQTVQSRLNRGKWIFLHSGRVPVRVGRLAKQMHLDGREEAELFREVIALVAKRRPPQRESGHQALDKWRLELARAYQRLGDTNRSTHLLTKLASRSKDSRQLQRITKLLEGNRERAKVVGIKDTLRPLRAEYLRKQRYPSRALKLMPQGDSLTPDALWQVALNRKTSDNNYVLLDQIPFWAIQGARSTVTGHQAVPRRANSIRYHLEPRYCIGKTGCDRYLVGIAGAMPVRNFRASFHVDYRPAKDYWPANKRPSSRMKSLADLKLHQGRPMVGFLFGMRDLDVPYVMESTPTGKMKRVYPRPAMGFRLAFRKDGVTLTQIVDSKRGSGMLWTTKVIKRWPLRLAANQFKVGVSLKGKRLRLTLGATTLEARLPVQPSGFRGFNIEGGGYAEVRRVIFGKAR
jgi:TolB-like protein